MYRNLEATSRRGPGWGGATARIGPGNRLHVVSSRERLTTQTDIDVSVYSLTPVCEYDACIGADATADCSVDVQDLAIVLANFGNLRVVGLAPANGDLNFDGTVSIQDLALVFARFGTSCP